MGFEPDRDRFFQYASFVMVGLTVLVCLCYALLFFNPTLNPIAALRPDVSPPTFAAVELPATWTPTPTPSRTYTPLPTNTFTPGPSPTFTPAPTETPFGTFAPRFVVVTNSAPVRIITSNLPTRAPATRPPPTPRPATNAPAAAKAPPAPPTPTVPPLPTAQQFAYRLGRPVESLPNCGTWYVSGTVYGDAAGSSRVNGLPVRIWAGGGEQGTDTTGIHSSRPGYWEWIFGAGTAAQGEVAIINTDGTLLSPRIPFTLTSDCNGEGATQEVVIDFVGQ